jgi:hypothetical protein
MRRILTTFLEQHPWGEVAQLDETTRKEVQIIHTLSRRAAQIYEDTMAPGELNAQDKDSVSLLLALRQEGQYSGSPAPHDSSTPGPSGMPPAPGSGPGARRAGGTGTSWAKYMNTQHNVMQQSPASSGGHEDDHSQRLLDHWLSANSTMAVGGGPASIPLDHALGYLPGMPLPLNATPGGPGGPGAGSMTPGAFPTTPAGFVNTPVLGGFMWGEDPLAGPSLPHNPGPGSVGSVGETFPVAPSSGLDGTVLGVGALGDGDGTGDEYWNTLIDGILSSGPGNG